MKKDFIISTLVISAFGVGAYLLYKKFYKKNEVEIITVKDLKKYIVYRDGKFHKKEENSQEIDDTVEEQNNEETEEEYEEAFEDSYQEYEEPSSNEGGIGKLRRGISPDSEYAYETFIRATIGNVENPSDVHTLRKLFEYEFVPINAVDRIAYDTLIEKRFEFFGTQSKYSSRPSWAELIMYYAERMNFDLDEGIPKWVNYILENLDFNLNMRDDDVNYILEDLVNHRLRNHYSGLFGMFGLDESAEAYMQTILSHKVEKDFSFEVEYNAFVNMTIGDE